ncbi:hypothetical protein [Listeria rustica]|uniref:Uncharacterized protein n=1 Tax=Listeria rustica TaxID=2713503 RepID=A0A7W1YFG4_9LIST|nr:hypothetical protein [Listeria rustica]MBA3925563.1 hypothetical protein [Listeria rustica]
MSTPLFYIPYGAEFYMDYERYSKKVVDKVSLESAIIELATECAVSVNKKGIECHYTVSAEDSLSGEPFELVFSSREPEEEANVIPLHYLGCAI